MAKATTAATMIDSARRGTLCSIIEPIAPASMTTWQVHAMDVLRPTMPGPSLIPCSCCPLIPRSFRIAPTRVLSSRPDTVLQSLTPAKSEATSAAAADSPARVACAGRRSWLTQRVQKKTNSKKLQAQRGKREHVTSFLNADLPFADLVSQLCVLCVKPLIFPGGADRKAFHGGG